MFSYENFVFIFSYLNISPSRYLSRHTHAPILIHMCRIIFDIYKSEDNFLHVYWLLLRFCPLPFAHTFGTFNLITICYCILHVCCGGAGCCYGVYVQNQSVHYSFLESMLHPWAFAQPCTLHRCNYETISQTFSGCWWNNSFDVCVHSTSCPWHYHDMT